MLVPGNVRLMYFFCVNQKGALYLSLTVKDYPSRCKMITQDKPQNIEKSESHHFMISIYCISQNLNHQSTILLSHIFFKSPLSGFLDAPGHNAPPGETMKHWNYLRRQTAFRVRSFTEEFADSKTVKRLMLLQEDLKLNMFSIHIYIYINCGF